MLWTNVQIYDFINTYILRVTEKPIVCDKTDAK